MRAFAQASDAIAATPKKTEKVRLLSEYFGSLALKDAARAAVFLTGQPFPRWEERVLGVGHGALIKLVLQLTGKTSADLQAVYREHGDLGAVAEELFAGCDRVAGLSIAQVAAAFDQIAAARAPNEKIAVLRKLLRDALPGEAKYIVKIITGDLRIGLKLSLVEEAIARTSGRSLDEVRHADRLVGDIGETLRLAFEDALSSVQFRIFRPIAFMLATPVAQAGEIIAAAGAPLAAEPKYDGIRAQIHKSGDQVKLFSRTLDEVTEFPELLPDLASLPGDFIADGEILAWDGSGPLPFTTLQRRLGRKELSLWAGSEIPVTFAAFDLLYRDGELLLDHPLEDRRQKLEGLIAAPTEKIRLAAQAVCNTAEAIESAFRSALAAGHEGIVAKRLDSHYMPGSRGRFWFKLKEPMATLDVVVTTVEYGHGKRHSVLSDYTFAVREGERLVDIGKAYSGLTDVEIAEYTRYFLHHVIRDEGFRKVVEPSVVLEVAFNNIQRSARHSSGYALRFPRIVRLRPDKPAAEIDTLDRVRELYERQFRRFA